MTQPDTRLAIYEGATLAGLVLDERNDDDSLGEPRSRVVVDTISGRTYHLQLGDAPGQAAGDRILRWYTSPPDPPELCPSDPSSFLANPSLETDAAGWGATAASSSAGDFFQRYLGDGVNGAACAEILIGAAATGRGLLYTDTSPHDWSGPSTITIWVKCAGGTPSPLVFHASVDGTPLPLVSATPAFAPTGAWQQVSLLYDALPGVTGPLTFSIETDGSAPSSSLVLRADCLQAQTTLEPPATPGNLACAPSENAIRLTWDAVPGSDGYYVRLGGSLVATVTSPTVTLTGLAPATSYDLAVSAFSLVRGESVAATITCATSAPRVTTGVDPSCEPLGFLDLNGREIINRARLVEYLRAGLGGDRWILRGADCDILTREIGVTPRDPAIDPAPWYDPQRPESADFLGVWAKIRVNRHQARAVTQTIGGLGGAVIGQARPAPTTIDVTCQLVSRSSRGAYYGRTWLESTLRSVSCDPCGLGTARLRLACPPDDGSADEVGEVFLYDVALAGEVSDQDQQTDGCCSFQTLGFQLLAGQPDLYHRTSLCASGTLNPDPGVCVPLCDWLVGPDDGSFASSIACQVANPNLFGTLGALITISADASQDLRGLEIHIYAAGTPCPPPVATPPTATLEIPNVPAGGVLVVDSARQLVTFYPTAIDALAATNAQSGIPFIALPEGAGMAWITADPCAPAGCLVVGKRTLCGGTGSVRIDTQLREA